MSCFFPPLLVRLSSLQQRTAFKPSHCGVVRFLRPLCSLLQLHNSLLPTVLPCLAFSPSWHHERHGADPLSFRFSIRLTFFPPPPPPPPPPTPSLLRLLSHGTISQIAIYKLISRLYINTLADTFKMSISFFFPGRMGEGRGRAWRNPRVSDQIVHCFKTMSTGWNSSPQCPPLIY